MARGTTRAMGWARRFWTPGTLGKSGLALVSVATGAALRVTGAVAHLNQSTGGAPVLDIDVPAGQETGLTVRLREVRDARNRKLIELPTTPGPSPEGPGLVRLTAVLDEEVQEAMYDGRWTVVLETASGVRSRVQSGLRDSRALIGSRSALLADPGSVPALARLTSYSTKEGHLAILSRRLDRHAEVRSVEVTDGSIVVHGTVFGAVRPSQDAQLMLRRRGGATTELTFDGTVTGHEFRFEVPAETLAMARLNRWEDWDCWLLPGGTPSTKAPEPATEPDLDLESGLRAGLDSDVRPAYEEAAEPDSAEPALPETAVGPIRIGRVLDDFVDVKPVFEYPAIPLVDGGVPGFSVVLPVARIDVRSFCTGSGELSVQVVERG